MWQLDWTKLADILTYDPRQPMIFSSGLFLFLFLGFSLIYALLQKRTTARLLFVSAFSYYFYYKSSGVYFFLLGVVSVSDYLLAARMARTETLWKRKMLVVVSLCINLGLLCYFKYTNFFYEILCPLWNGHYEAFDIFLPVGISFFTFQSLSYTIDEATRQSVGLCVLCFILSTACSRSHRTCPRLYSANPSAPVCFERNVRTRSILYCERII